MKKIRIILWVLVLTAIAVSINLLKKAEENIKPVTVTKSTEVTLTDDEVKIGGKFNLIDQHGNSVTEESFKNMYTVVFFGFTNCPMVCPTGLSQMSLALKQLDKKEEQVLPVFITVDPERDTPEILQKYLKNFGENFIGLTGSKEQVMEVQKAYKIYSKKMEQRDAPNGYLMDHSAFIYLMGKNGEYLTHFTNENSPEFIASKIKEYLHK